MYQYLGRCPQRQTMRASFVQLVAACALLVCTPAHQAAGTAAPVWVGQLPDASEPNYGLPRLNKTHQVTVKLLWNCLVQLLWNPKKRNCFGTVELWLVACCERA